jgi:hypothetical protein
MSISKMTREVAPPPASVKSPGLARATVTKSASVRYSDPLLTASTSGEFTRWQIGSKLVSGL